MRVAAWLPHPATSAPRWLLLPLPPLLSSVHSSVRPFLPAAAAWLNHSHNPHRFAEIVAVNPQARLQQGGASPPLPRAALPALSLSRACSRCFRPITSPAQPAQPSQIKLWFSGHFHLSHDYRDSVSALGSCAFVQARPDGPRWR